MNRRRVAIAAAACGGLFLGGCVERRINITSDPSGARVFLNDQDVGVTPLEVDFTWFGVYDVRVTKSGFEPLITSREAKAPLHETPPFDFVALMMPGTKRTRIDWHFELAPANNDPVGLLERATSMRARVLAEGEAWDEAAEGSVSRGDVSETTPRPELSPAADGPAPVEAAPVREVASPAPTGAPDWHEVTPR